jgi:hypothetical protein
MRRDLELPGPSAFEVDHVFVAASVGAPEVDGLRAAGFEEGPGNVHQGQGTACRRWFFDNAYLELIWIEDRRAASSPEIARTCLAARAGREKGASRLGVSVRPRSTGGVALPVDTWSYRPPYLPGGVAIPMACNSTVAGEPLLFFMPGERSWSAPRLPHPNGARRVTGIAITRPPRSGPPTPEMQWLQRWEGIQIDVGRSELLRLELDHGARGESLDLAPAVPLAIAW